MSASLNIEELKSSLRSRLAARRINYNLFIFDGHAATVLGKLRGIKLSIDVPYSIVKEGNILKVSGFSWTKEAESEDQAVGIIVRNIRKNEMRFNKYLN